MAQQLPNLRDLQSLRTSQNYLGQLPKEILLEVRFDS
jgi:hypothetical protein